MLLQASSRGAVAARGRIPQDAACTDDAAPASARVSAGAYCRHGRGMFPSQMSLDEGGRLKSERRLAYVGVKGYFRAMQKLTPTQPETRVVCTVKRLYHRLSRVLSASCRRSAEAVRLRATGAINDGNAAGGKRYRLQTRPTRAAQVRRGNYCQPGGQRRA